MIFSAFDDSVYLHYNFGVIQFYFLMDCAQYLFMNYAIFNCKLNEKKFCIYAENILLDIMDIVMHPKIHRFL